jgi:hypothetical protein
VLPRVCEGGVDKLVLVRPRAAGPAGPVEAAVRQVVGEIPVPAVQVKMSPTVGIARMDTWFWAEGYSGQPVFEGRDALGRRIEVEATPSFYRWDFGDGTAPVETASLGRPWPEPDGAVTHAYTKMSEGFPVSVTFVFDVRYRVDGGPWIGLEPIERAATTPYRVGEVRTVVVSRG